VIGRAKTKQRKDAGIPIAKAIGTTEDAAMRRVLQPAKGITISRRDH
jgi:hypothetical protein